MTAHRLRCRGERGSGLVAGIVLIFAFTFLGMVWLARDVDRGVSNRSAAQSIAFQAARSGAQSASIADLRTNADASAIDEQAARRAATATADALFASYDVDRLDHVDRRRSAIVWPSLSRSPTEASPSPGREPCERSGHREPGFHAAFDPAHWSCGRQWFQSARVGGEQVRREPVDVGRVLASIVALVALVVALPVGLVAVSRARFGSANPLAGVDLGWLGDDAASTLTRPIADDTVIDALIRLSLCVAWVAIAVIVVTTTLEVAHMIRHRGLPMPSVRGIGWAQRVARFIAVGLIVLIPVSTSSPSIATSLSGRTTPTLSHEVESRTDTESSSDAPGDRPASTRRTFGRAIGGTSMVTHVVRPGESVYSIAERLAATTAGSVIDIAESIVDANLGATMGPGQRFTNPAYVEVGWVLQIPADLVAAPVVRPAEVTLPVDAYIVERGDTLWDIADEQLGDPTAWPEIWEDNAGDDMGGGRTFDDPDLILPGWELDLPGDDARRRCRHTCRRCAARRCDACRCRSTRRRRADRRRCDAPRCRGRVRPPPATTMATPTASTLPASIVPAINSATTAAEHDQHRPGQGGRRRRRCRRGTALRHLEHRRHCGWNMRHSSLLGYSRWSGSVAADGCGPPCHAIGCPSLDPTRSRPSVGCEPSTRASGHSVSTSHAALRHGRSSVAGHRSDGSR